MTGWSAVTWDTARAGGLISYLLLTTAVSLGLVLRNRWQSTRWPRLVTNELHGYVSLLALVFIAVHVVAVAIDVCVPVNCVGSCRCLPASVCCVRVS